MAAAAVFDTFDVVATVVVVTAALILHILLIFFLFLIVTSVAAVAIQLPSPVLRRRGVSETPSPSLPSGCPRSFAFHPLPLLSLPLLPLFNPVYAAAHSVDRKVAAMTVAIAITAATSVISVTPVLVTTRFPTGINFMAETTTTTTIVAHDCGVHTGILSHHSPVSPSLTITIIDCIVMTRIFVIGGNCRHDDGTYEYLQVLYVHRERLGVQERSTIVACS